MAKAAGVSAATVSNAIRGRGRMAPETKAKVLAVARQLGYSVNLSARRLRTARAGAIGIYLPDSKSSLAYYMDFCFGVVDSVEPWGTAVTLIPGRSVHVAHPLQVDGFLLIDPPADDEAARSILTSGVPVVSGDGVPQSLPQPAGEVVSDHAQVIADLLDHLSARGARRQALISAGDSTRWSQEVELGYLAWTAKRNVAANVVDASGASSDDVDHLTNVLLDQPSPPDAIIAVPADTASRTVAIARSRGCHVGDSLLVAGYADSPALSLSVPPITAVDLRPRRLGELCAKLLLRLLETGTRDTATVSEQLEVELIERASTLGSGS